MMFDRGLKEAVEVEGQVQLEREKAEGSPGNAENVKGGEKTRKISEERIERLKRAFRPSQLRDTIEIREDGNQRKKQSNNT